MQGRKEKEDFTDSEYEFCPHCEANLTLQKGYSPKLLFWNCRGCGEMLINPELEVEGDIAWICDGCGAMLNIQKGFTGEAAEWKCRECGYKNRLDPGEIYLSEDEYQAELRNPYRGMSDEDVLDLSLYEEQEILGEKPNVLLVKHRGNGRFFVKKVIKGADFGVYRYLYENPVDGMPRIRRIFEGSNYLVLIEDYIEGRTLAEMIRSGPLTTIAAVDYTIQLCRTVQSLHGLKKPLIHRDIKPSNIVISKEGRVFLLDLNAAKWYQPEKAEDTRLFGTLYYAAPEQFGYGFSSSSEKSDVYAIGMVLNVMLTGKMPKEKKAEGHFYEIVEKCIYLEPEKRCSVNELLEMLENRRDC